MPLPQDTEDFYIIIVDDDQLVRDFAVHTIEYGINREVATFDSGFKAWQFIVHTPEKADIIIADANIPDMDGMELLRRIKQDHPKKKFVLTTSNPALEKEANQCGADAFLSKPYDIKDLFAVVQKFYTTAAQTRQNNLAILPNNDEPPSTDSE